MKNEKYQMYENVKSKMLNHSAIGCPAYTQSRLLGEMMIMLILVVMVILVIIVLMMVVVMMMMLMMGP